MVKILVFSLVCSLFVVLIVSGQFVDWLFVIINIVFIELFWELCMGKNDVVLMYVRVLKVYVLLFGVSFDFRVFIVFNNVLLVR